MTTSYQRIGEDALTGRLVDGRYRIGELLAHGGMGSVYLAVDQRLERDVAVKVMRPDLARDPDFVHRFRREAKSAARLAHPNVVAVYDQGDDDGLVFLVMELVAGQTLRGRLTQHGALSVRQALVVLRAVLSALAAAHAAGLVHRDVKPENVLLSPDGTVKVADFGLARAVTSATATAVTGAVLGTAAYLAPEQFERGVADARSDVYAAGLLLMEMLTGRKAVDGDEPMQVAYQHVHGTIPLPSHRVATLPSQLDRLVEWATQRDPDQRPADARQFLDAVEAAAAELSDAQLDAPPEHTEITAPLATATRVVPLANVGERTGATPVGPAGGARPTRRWRRMWSVLLVVLLTAAAVGGGYALLGPPSARTVPEVAGQAEAVAVQWLQDRQLDAAREGVYSETVPAGQVIGTQPEAGGSARRGSTIRLLVSNGPERYAVPDVAGQDPKQASDAIAAARLTVADRRTTTFDERVPAGKVVGTDPAVGQRVKPGTAVTLLVSQGPPVTIKNWVGKPVDEVKAGLDGTSVTVVVTAQEFHSSIAKGSVVRQDPGPGQVARGSRLSLVLSKGPDLVEVPAVRGMSEEAARGALTAAGFQVRTERIVGGLFGTAHSTVPGAGRTAPRGGTIVLRIV